MRTTAAALAALLTLAAAAPAAADSMTVQLNHSARVSLPGSAANVFIGNAAIADAMIVDRRSLVVLGKGYGVTNILVIDAAGRTILNRRVQVSSGNDGRVTMIQGSKASNFTCAPMCEHVPTPGETDAGSGADQGSAGSDSGGVGGALAGAAAGAAAGVAAGGAVR